jgi:MoaA/NifB/PqqE/SkfB family radical SAM enzyme
MIKKEDISPENYVCTKPFEWYEIAWNKEVYPCCPGWLPHSIGKMPDQKPEAIWNSKAAKKIRESVLDGSFSYCSAEYCLHLKEKTWPVKKAKDIDLEQYIRLIDNPEPPIMVSCSYDKSCNLACPSCRSEVLAANKEERSKYDQLIQDLLADYGHNLKTISITGSGDPFASRHFWDLLQSGVLAKYPDLKIRLHTNAQLLDEFHWNRIAPLHEQIEAIEISIDAASAETYAINRAPGDWNQLIKNMDYVGGLRKSGKIKLLQLDFVVQLNNYNEMPEFARLAKQWNADRIVFTSLNNWGTYTPQQYREIAIHSSKHPLHYLLERLLKDDIFKSSEVFIGFQESDVDKNRNIVLDKIPLIAV